MTKKQNTKSFLCRALTTVSAATAVATMVALTTYIVVANLDKPENKEKHLYNARIKLDMDETTRDEIMTKTFNGASYIAQKRIVEAMGYKTLDDFYNTYPVESKVDSVEKAIEEEAMKIFDETLVYLPEVEAAEATLERSHETVEKLKQDSIALKNYYNTPIKKRFLQNWNSLTGKKR